MATDDACHSWEKLEARLDAASELLKIHNRIFGRGAVAFESCWRELDALLIPVIDIIRRRRNQDAEIHAADSASRPE